VEGSTVLTGAELEWALLPFLGPDRVLEDVEQARAALEKAHSDRGFQSVTVAIPPQTVRDGVVTLKVTEGRVGRLRVQGAHWFLPREVKRQAPSVAEGTVPNFEGIVRDIVALNQLPDRRVTPALRAGVEPGTVDVDLNVEDQLPLHGSLELNNRQSANTTRLRLNGSLRYDNLWQLGHSLAFAFQTAPRRPEDALVFSLSYLARLPGTPWLTLTFSGVVQDSDVSTLGGAAVQGKGRILGSRASFTLPGGTDFFHSLGTGLDYKRFNETLSFGIRPDGSFNLPSDTPITYWPVTTQYAASWTSGASQTQLSGTILFSLRPLGSSAQEFDAKRYQASGSFIIYRADAARTQELGGGAQLFARVQGQYADDPVLASEQITAGGAESVRGYMEVEASGDRGALGTVELRSPTLTGWLGLSRLGEWRLLVFSDAATLRIMHPLPEQQSGFRLWSAGGGTRVRFLEHLFGGADVGVPLTSVGTTTRYHPRFHLRLAGEF
jgi:hemolysin activation/secretion protein